MIFDKALKTFLRQDPDIILVGEICDKTTADIAIKAANRHLVMSALYTNDAPQALTCLIDMGISPFEVANGIKLIIAQRLVRCLCDCKIEQNLPEVLLLK